MSSYVKNIMLRATEDEKRELLEAIEKEGSDYVWGLSDHLNIQKANFIHAGSIVEESLERIPKPGEIIGISTGYKSLDEMTKGLAGGEVSVWFGATSQGKSQITQNIALNVAKSGTGVLILPLEMGIYNTTARLRMMFGEENEDEFKALPI